jgi:peptide/nickel transport system permease protein
MRPGEGVAARPEAAAHGELEHVQARSYWDYVWLRFKRDKLAVASAVFIVFVLVGSFAGPPLASYLVGHGPNDVFVGTTAVSPGLLPAGPWTWVEHERPLDRPPYVEKQRQLLVLGAANRLGQDELLRLLYGARASLEVAILSTLGIMLLGVVLGVMAGYFGGWVDGVIWRLAEVAMVFPVLLFIIALAATAGPRLDKLTLGGTFPPGVIKLAVVFSIFGWFYPARIMRAQTLAIREKEYVEAARMIGAGDLRIVRSHVLPHLAGPIIVYSSLILATQILAEAGLSYLSLGIQEPNASWGNMLANATQYYSTRPLLVLWPGLAILLTTVAFNLLGDGVRDAFDPGGPVRTNPARKRSSIVGTAPNASA